MNCAEIVGGSASADSNVASADGVTLRDLFAALSMSEYVDAFAEQRIDANDLHLLGRDQLEKLIPEMGPRARLERKLDEMKSSASGGAKNELYRDKLYEPVLSSLCMANACCTCAETVVSSASTGICFCKAWTKDPLA